MRMRRVSKAVTRKWSGRDSNPWPFGSRANALPLSYLPCEICRNIFDSQTVASVQCCCTVLYCIVLFNAGACESRSWSCVSAGSTCTRCCRRRHCRVENCRRFCSQCRQTATRFPCELSPIFYMHTLSCVISLLLWIYINRSRSPGTKNEQFAKIPQWFHLHF